MAKGKEPPASLAGIGRQTAEQITGQTQEPMENYFSWLQKATSACPWGNTDLNRKLLSYATENLNNAFGFVQKLSQAKTSEDVVKIQTEFITAQFTSCNDQAKNIVEIYTRTAAAMMTS